MVRDNFVVNRWNFDWRRELFVWESHLLHDLIVRLEEVVLGDGPDCWVWKWEEGRVFFRKIVLFYKTCV
jgi:hypothetical protein